jgi:hypothetical protein
LIERSKPEVPWSQIQYTPPSRSRITVAKSTIERLRNVEYTTDVAKRHSNLKAGLDVIRQSKAEQNAKHMAEKAAADTHDSAGSRGQSLDNLGIERCSSDEIGKNAAVCSLSDDHSFIRPYFQAWFHADIHTH